MRLGIDTLDEDHRLVLSIGQALNQALKDRSRLLALAGADVLVDACRSHFRREEQTMSSCRFPWQEDHDEAHRLMLEQLDQMRLDTDSGLWLPAQDRLLKILCIVQDHVEHLDSVYGLWLAKEKLVPVYENDSFVGWAKPSDR